MNNQLSRVELEKICASLASELASNTPHGLKIPRDDYAAIVAAWRKHANSLPYTKAQQHNDTAALLEKLVRELGRNRPSAALPDADPEACVRDTIALAEPYIDSASLPYFRRQISRWRENRRHPAILAALSQPPRVVTFSRA